LPFSRTTILPTAKLAGKGVGHECPSYGELRLFLVFVFL
jgi:hypothetical protein